MNLRERKELEAQRLQEARQRLTLHNKASKVPPYANPCVVDLKAILYPYRSYFLKDPELVQIKTKSNSLEKQLLELVRGCLCKYRVSPQFLNIWLRKISIPGRFYQEEPRTTISGDPIRWFLCVAQGESLYKNYSKPYLTKPETHTLVTCPHDLTFEQTLVFAAAKTFTSRDGFALRLAHSKLSTLPFNAFLKTVIYFFAKNPPESLEEVNDLIDFIMSRHQISQTWSLAGRTLESIRQKCKDWHYELRRIKVMGNHQWEGAPIPDTVIQTGSESQPMKWHFTQIKSSKLLAEEGTKMRHCVYGYKNQCVNGQTYIWSLSREEHGLLHRRVTIELSNSGDIVQARGLANRTIRSEERYAVLLWARENGLNLKC